MGTANRDRVVAIPSKIIHHKQQAATA
jgi:hypothetical protein